jgi:hypothetical protein
MELEKFEKAKKVKENLDRLETQKSKLEYALADYPDLISINGNFIQVALPVISLVQETIPYAGSWTVTLYNVREEERQSLSKALKPKADL